MSKDYYKHVHCRVQWSSIVIKYYAHEYCINAFAVSSELSENCCVEYKHVQSAKDRRALNIELFALY